MHSGKKIALLLVVRLMRYDSCRLGAVRYRTFLAQPFGGSNHILQTDAKALTYLVHYLAHNSFRSECREDPTVALVCLASTLRLLAKSLLIIISVIACISITHRFTCHFYNQMYSNLFRLEVIVSLTFCFKWNQVT